MNKTKFSAKDISIAALLTALALLIPMYMPFKLVLEPIFSATFAAHVPGILSMFIGPFAVIGTALGSAIGFMTLSPWVAARAFVHLVFGLVGYRMLKKNYNIFLVIFLTGIVHAASEMVVGLISLPFVVTPANGILFYILVTVGCGTFIHHCIDFAISLIIFAALKSAKLVSGTINYKSFKL